MKRRDFFKHAAAAPLLPGASAAEPRLRAGFAEADITPNVPPEKLHDPLKVRAAVFDDGRTRVALASVDAIGVPRPLVLNARRAIQAACGISPEAVLIAATHSHSAGPVGWSRPEQLQHENTVLRKLAEERQGDREYTARVERQIVAAVAEADRRKSAARCGFGSGEEDKVSFNRRVRMKSGLTYTHPGTGNPDSVGFAGPIDPEVGVVGTWDSAGKLAGCIVNFACHATTSPPGISANWPYYMEKVIRQVMGESVIVLFLPGCCGDVTQVDNFSARRMPTGDEYARLIGGRVGAEAVRTLLMMHPGDEVPLGARQAVLTLRFRKPRPDRVKRALEVVQMGPKQADPTELFFARIIAMHAALTDKRDTEEAEVQAIQIGPAVFLTNPSELFCKFGLEMKSRSPFPKTFPVELANGSVGYVPTDDSFGPHGGGYETRIGVSRLELGAGGRFVEAALKLAGELRPGPMPLGDPAPAFEVKPANIGPHPWSYGNVPPELS